MASGKSDKKSHDAEEVDLSTVACAEIQADLKRSEIRLLFAGVIFVALALSFMVKTCVEHPPPPHEDESVTCVKVGGTWHPASYDKDTHRIDAFCAKE